VPIQGPPSASKPSRKVRERRPGIVTAPIEYQTEEEIMKRNIKRNKAKSKYLRKKALKQGNF